MAAESCGCTPWNYPQTISQKVCDGVQSFCFESAMQSPVQSQGCDCLPDCEKVSFSVNHHKFKLDYDHECGEQEINLDGIDQLKETDLKRIVAEQYR